MSFLIFARLSIYNHSQEILRQAQNIPTRLKINPVFLQVQLRISHHLKTSLEYPSLLRLAQNASLFFRTILEYSYPSELKILCNCGKVIETYYKSMLNSDLDMQKLNNFKVSLSHPAN